MKKLLLTACCIIFISIHSKAQLDTIPNAGFENWYYTPIWTLEAAGWHSNNSSITASNVMPDSVPHSGQLALALIDYSYRGRIWSGFPVSQHPASLNGFIKIGLSIADSAFIHIHIYSSNILVDSGYAAINGGIVTNYLPFTVSVTQNFSSADSCVITLEGGNYFGSSIFFDDLSLSFPTSVKEENEYNAWNIFPNPCNERLFITANNGMIENSILSIQDMSGRTVWEKNIQRWSGAFPVNTGSLFPGIYLLTMRDSKNKNIILHKLIARN